MLDEDLAEIFDKVNAKPPSEAWKDFHTEPLTLLSNYYRFNQKNLDLLEARQFNITRLLETDMYYRYHNQMDAAMNFVGESGGGKSNCLLHYGLLWSSITGVPWRSSSVVWSQPEFNLLLRGMKMRVFNENGKPRVDLEDRPLEAGASISLDEASDLLVAGLLSLTISLGTADLESRVRRMQVARFAAATRPILHMAYVTLEIDHRDVFDKSIYCIAYKEVRDANGLIKRINLGSVRVPYVKKEVFEHYDHYKVQAIQQFGKNVATNRVSQLIDYLAKKLYEDEVYQALPIKPDSQRINWMSRNPVYSIFPTQKFFTELYRLSINKELNEKLTKKDKRLHEFGESDEGGE